MMPSSWTGPADGRNRDPSDALFAGGGQPRPPDQTAGDAGRARRRSGAARPNRPAGGRGPRRRRLLGLPQARRQLARALRHRGPEARVGAPVAAQGRAGPRRPDRRDRRADQHPRRLPHPRLPLPARDRRGGARELPRGAGPAARRGARRARRAEPGAPGLHRRRGLRARGHRDGDRRDGRARRLRRPGRDGARAPAPAAVLRARASSARRASPRAPWCCTSRRSSSPTRSPTTRPASAPGCAPRSRRCGPRSTRCWRPTI